MTMQLLHKSWERDTTSCLQQVSANQSRASLLKAHACLRLPSHAPNQYTFEAYTAEFAKTYSAAEVGLKKVVFEMNLAKVKAHNT